MAEHHGGGGGDAQLVRGAHHVEPFLAAAFALGDEAPNAVVEYLGAGPGQGIQAGLLECLEHLVVGGLFQLGDVGDLRRPQRVEFQIGIEGLELTEKVDIKIEPKIRVMAALQQKLIAAEAEQLVNFFFVFLNGGCVGLLVPRPAVEVAELAIGDADVGGVGVAVYDPGHYVSGYMLLPQLVGGVHQLGGGAIFEEEEALFGAEEI